MRILYSGGSTELGHERCLSPMGFREREKKREGERE